MESVTTSKAQRVTDAVVSLLLLMIAVSYVLSTLRLPEPRGHTTVGPEVFPLVIGISLTVLCGVYAVSSVGRLLKHPVTPDHDGTEVASPAEGGLGAMPEDEDDLKTFQDVQLLLLRVALLVAYAFSFLNIDWVLSSAVFIFAVLSTCDRQLVIRNVLVALGATAFIFLLFDAFVYVPLPTIVGGVW